MLIRIYIANLSAFHFSFHHLISLCLYFVNSL
nr:MAG TPA: hypothetical protein [Caudoviricetes sp.]